MDLLVKPRLRRVGVLAVWMIIHGPAGAIAEQPSATDIIEQACAHAREIEDLKKVLTGRDQTMRIATFKAMMATKDDAIRGIALDTGLASTDRVLQALAFKYAVVPLGRINFTLEVDSSAPEAVQKRTATHISRYGNVYSMSIGVRDVDTGKFAEGPTGRGRGEVSGTVMSLKYGSWVGRLHLEDDDRLVGLLNRSKSQFRATARFR